MEGAKELTMYPISDDKTTVIPKGYYLKARKIEESDIAHAAPCVRETWDWILRQCNHMDNNGIKRGQCVRKISDIQDGLHWFVGYRKMTYSKTQCEHALEYLRKTLMITTAKTTRGLVITVCNYDTYQNPKNYEDNNESNKKTTRRQQQGDTINKNDKNDKNVIVAGWQKTNNGFFFSEVEANSKESMIEEYLELVDFLHGKNKSNLFFTNVLSLESQITYREFVNLKETAAKSSKTIGQVLVSMENKPRLKKDYKSVYLTANNWLQNDFNKK